MSLNAKERIAEEVIVERERQDVLWGEQNHDLPTFISILAEEVGEAARCCNDYHFSADGSVAKPVRLLEAREELIQVAAVACAIVERIDRMYGGKVDAQELLEFGEEE